MSHKRWFITMFIVLLAICWKAWLLALDAFPFNADEAVVGLMARHILSGSRPIFFYGQAYMGSLDAYLVAMAFAIFGQSVLVIRITQLVLYIGTIITTIAIAKIGFNSLRAGWFSALLLAIPPVNTTLYTTVSLGGYGEAILIGNLILLVGLWQNREPVHAGMEASIKFFLLGLLTGLGLWANGLTLVYSLPVILFTFVRVRKFGSGWKLVSNLTLALGGFFFGSFPWWVFAVSNGLQALLGELMGTAVAVETQPWLQVVGQHAVNFGLFGITALLGFRPPWEVKWLALPLTPAVILFWIGIIIFWVRKGFLDEKYRTANILLAATGFCLTAGFLFTPFGVDPSGRYFLPLWIVLCLVAGGMATRLKKPVVQFAIIGLVMVFNGWGTLECVAQRHPGITTQFNAITQVDMSYQDDLITFLLQKGETRGFTNYWVAYPLAFQSGEAIIFSPRLPYHANLGYTSRDDRYLPYSSLAERSEKAAYITTRNPALDELLRSQFGSRGITWLEEKIGDFVIFYHLSKKITPEELDISPKQLSFARW